ncbi:hypothetical protein BJ085DRAFT_32371 [Dimargaris cristalligena]|uniref:aspartyl aminopeptidase n=1 Tax=Dimargaris cristalligena TaxID=215637 RepID=A0A4P9ZY39_9FUNG|nr:hypothetical protein BJ085DRAFT_32371 [Dimargaris cristalligena]|eukprot:RKP38606.1 hypothetical protein BJ085DRAFT_32371 [Dimargaris cristalligena]
MLPPKASVAALGKPANVNSLRAYANQFLTFVNASPSPFHAVEACRQRLVAHGFQELKERQAWSLEPNGKYFFTRNASSIVAFAVGGQFRPGQGVSIVAAHTDSPCLKLKPISKLDRAGYLQVGVQCYGGGLWHTWFDRDLSLAGRVMVADNAEGNGTSFSNRLVRIDRPILRIPNLAIHLDRSVNDGFTFNKETHLTPILATIAKRFNNPSGTAASPKSPSAARQTADTSESESEAMETRRPSHGGNAPGAGLTSSSSPLPSSSSPSLPPPMAKDIANDGHTAKNHHPELLQLLADELQVDVQQIRDFELCLYDTQPAALGGIYEEFIYSPRLDNLMMSYTALESLINSADSDPLRTSSGSGPQPTLAQDTQIRLIALFDNEEIGSQSAYGADSAMLESTLRRLQSFHTFPATSNPATNTAAPSHLLPASDALAFEQSIHASFLISADMAHAVHPNYVDRHEARHRPVMHNGIVIKVNANQRYATTAPTSLVLKALADKHTIRLQEFVVRNDSSCGSTIGPILSAKLGLRTIDVGCPQLAMHSIREMAGADDVGHAIALFTAFFNEFGELDMRIQVD